MADQTMPGWLTSVSPLRVQVHGATVDSPAAWLGDGSGASVGDSVQVTVRSPQVPLVQGKATT